MLRIWSSVQWQAPEVLASAGQTRSTQEKQKDAQELEALRAKEQAEKHTRNMQRGSRCVLYLFVDLFWVCLLSALCWERICTQWHERISSVGRWIVTADVLLLWLFTLFSEIFISASVLVWEGLMFFPAVLVYRHSRFRGSYVVQGLKSIGEKDVIFHQGLHNVSLQEALP